MNEIQNNENEIEKSEPLSAPEIQHLEAQLLVDDWGCLEYETALKNQELLVNEMGNLPPHPNRPGFLIFCSHPPVVTTGRGTKENDISSWAGSRIEVSRGGRATYHGPSQLVVYPIVDLRLQRKGRKPNDVGGFLRALESGIIHGLARFGVITNNKPESDQLMKYSADDNLPQVTGVWVGDRKICSIGIGVRKWISFHGAAVNVDEDPTAFSGMNPCGFKPEVMISLEKVLGVRIHREAFLAIMKESLQKAL